MLKLTKFLIFTSGLLLGILLVVFIKQPAAVDQNKTPEYLDKDQLFATIYGEDYSIGRILGDDFYELEEELFDNIQDRLIDLYYDEYFDQTSIKEENLSEEEVKNYYSNNGLESYGSYEELRAQIIELLQNNIVNRALQAQFSEDLNQNKIVYHVSLPGKNSNLISFSNDRPVVAGDIEAKVALIEFSDLQCPFCRRVQPVMEELVNNYGRTVGFYFRHFPLSSIHKQAEDAALAFECALEQNKLAQYKDMLFNNQSKLQREDLIGYAAELNLNKADFTACFDTDKYKTIVETDKQLAAKLGLTGTPTVFIGLLDPNTKEFAGEAVVGAYPYEKYAEKLDQYLLE